MTFLFHELIFGPVTSRRLGTSLGINLLPVNYKYCTFNCVYCECGWTHKEHAEKIRLPKKEEVEAALEEKLKTLKQKGPYPDAITFAGNGEPTIHPEFPEIVDITIRLRDQYFPEAQISVLSNASMLHKKEVFESLKKVDQNIQKLDTAIEETFRIINRPGPNHSLDKIVKHLKAYKGNVIIQTLFLRGSYQGEHFDNTTREEVEAWLKKVKEIDPQYVMIYPIARETPAEDIEKIRMEELMYIAARVEAEGIPTKVFG